MNSCAPGTHDAPSVAPLFTREDLPVRWQAVVTLLANHTGLTVESAALLALTHFASWCGERSGCYSVDETWTPAACNQIVVFEDAGVMQGAREFLLDEFCRMEVALRASITETWRDVALGSAHMRKVIDPTHILTEQFKKETEGWITWLRNPTPAGMSVAVHNAFRQGLTVCIDDPVLVDAMISGEADWLIRYLHKGICGSHVFCTRGAELNGVAAAAPVSPLAMSVLIYATPEQALQMVTSSEPYMSSLVQQCMVWTPELAEPGRLAEPPRERHHPELCFLQSRTTEARLKSTGTRWITKDAAPVMFAWQEACRALRADLFRHEEAAVTWMDVLPYKLAVPLMVTARHAEESAGGFFQLAVKLSRYAVRNALSYVRQCYMQYTPLMRLIELNPRRWSKLSAQELAIMGPMIVSGRGPHQGSEGRCPPGRPDLESELGPKELCCGLG